MAVLWRSGARGRLQQIEGHESFLVTSGLQARVSDKVVYRRAGQSWLG